MATTELSFNISNLISIGVVLISSIVGYVKLHGQVKNNHKDIESIETDFKEDKIHAKNSRNAIKKEMTENLKEKEAVIMKRIDKTQNDMKAYFSKADQKTETMNEKLNQIIGMLRK